MKTDVSVRDIDTGVQVWDTCTVRVSVLCWSCQMVWSVGVLVQGLGHPDSPSPPGCCCTYSLLLHPPSSAPRLQLHRGQAADTTAHCTASQTTSRTSRLIINLPGSCLQAPLYESHPGVLGDSDSSAPPVTALVSAGRGRIERWKVCAGLARRSTESSLSAISGCTPCSAETRRGGAADWSDRGCYDEWM